MPKNIVIPVAIDHEALTDRKIALAQSLLEPGGKITLLTVLESIPAFASEFVTVKMDNHLTTKIRAQLESRLPEASGIEVAVVMGKPGVQIVEYAQDHGADLIIVGAHQPGALDYFLGSTAARVARRAPCSVHILR